MPHESVRAGLPLFHDKHKSNTIMKVTIKILGLAALLITASCSPVLYAPVGQNVPLFHEKGEVALSGGYCETWDARGVSLQFATAVNNKVLVTSSFYSMSDAYGGSEDFWEGHGTYFEAGVGRYGYSPESKFTYELIGGLGYGSMKNKYNYSTVNANYIKPFFQPSFGVSGGVAEFAVTARIGYVAYVSHSNTMPTPEERYRVDQYFDEKSSSLAFEPGLTFRFGYRNVKLVAQYCYSTFNYKDDEDIDPVNPEFLSVGLHVLITDRFKK